MRGQGHQQVRPFSPLGEVPDVEARAPLEKLVNIAALVVLAKSGTQALQRRANIWGDGFCYPSEREGMELQQELARRAADRGGCERDLLRDAQVWPEGLAAANRQRHSTKPAVNNCIGKWSGCGEKMRTPALS